MKRLSFLIFILILFVNCTIQKRVYRKGWDIRIEKNLKKTEINEVHTTLFEEKVIVTNTNLEIVDNVIDENFLFNKGFGNQFESDMKVVPKTEPSASKLESEKNSLKKNKMPGSFVIDIPPDETIKTHDGPAIGILMIITSLVMAALTILILVASEVSLIALIGAIVLGALSVLFLALGIFFVIRKAREKKFPELKEDRLNRLKAKKESPEYNPNKVNVIISAISFAVVIGLVILLRNIE